MIQNTLMRACVCYVSYVILRRACCTRLSKVKEIDTTARFVKVLTRRLQIREPVALGALPEDGRVLGELVVRCVWKQTDPAQVICLRASTM